jgi:predicted lipoprotein with Yx(FWY)xxD motif
MHAGRRLALLAGAALIVACGSGTPGAKRSPVPTPPPALETQLADSTVDPTIAAQYGPPAVKVVESSDGRRVLADLSGKTLYVLHDDVPASGVSNCTRGCINTWFPLTVGFGPGFQIPGLGLFGTFLRDDGSRQVTYRGRPLYRYVGDNAPGDTNGDGVDGRWSVAVP